MGLGKAAALQCAMCILLKRNKAETSRCPRHTCLENLASRFHKNALSHTHCTLLSSTLILEVDILPLNIGDVTDFSASAVQSVRLNYRCVVNNTRPHSLDIQLASARDRRQADGGRERGREGDVLWSCDPVHITHTGTRKHNGRSLLLSVSSTAPLPTTVPSSHKHSYKPLNSPESLFILLFFFFCTVRAAKGTGI